MAENNNFPIVGNTEAKDFLLFNVNRGFTNLAKNFLVILEDLVQIDEYVIQQDKFQRLRKKVLDSSMDSKRNLEYLIEKMEVNYKKSS